MGTSALIIFLCSLGLGLLSLVVLVVAALAIYKTLRYGYKDVRVWSEAFLEFNQALQATLKRMEQRARNVTEAGIEMRKNIEDIQDALDELRTNPLLRAAHFIARFRRG